MGCNQSTFEVDQNILGHDPDSVRFYKSLSLDKGDMSYLDKAFSHIDVDDSKYIRMDECMAYFEVEHSKFNECMFSVFSDQDIVHISFIEFVSTMWNFLTVTTLNMSKFVFTILSPDKDALSPEEVIGILLKIHSKASLNSNNSNTLDELRSMKSDKLFNVEQFAKLVRIYPSLIAPILHLQMVLRKHLIGESFWINLELNRKNKSKDEFNDVTWLSDMKAEVKALQEAQLHRMADRQNVAKALAKKKKAQQESDQKLGKKKLKSGHSMDTFSDLGEEEEDRPDRPLTIESTTGLHVASLKRQRTPTILLRNANLARKEKRAKKNKKTSENRAQDEAVSEPESLTLSGKESGRKPGRMTLAMLRKKAQRAKGKQVSPE